jgi:hypothetical protein
LAATDCCFVSTAGTATATGKRRTTEKVRPREQSETANVAFFHAMKEHNSKIGRFYENVLGKNGIHRRDMGQNTQQNTLAGHQPQYGDSL